MLHIGHFSFDALEGEEGVRHGYFTCIIDAKDPEQAVAKFGGRILRLQKSETPFAGMIKVYIEDIIKVEKLPQDPIVTHLQSSEGEFPKSISYSLPAVIKDGIEAFGLPSSVDRHESEKKQTKDRFEFSNPFIRFESSTSDM
jgi:hypothetical protein